MTVVSVSEQFQPNRYLIVSNRSDPESITTTRVIVSDLRTNTINLVTIEKGSEGVAGPQGPVGPPGQDGLIFDILSVASGGTNNSVFNSGYLLEYDGSKISSTSYTVQDIINLGAANSDAITGIIAGTGLQKVNGPNNTVLLDVKIGNGLAVSGQQIIVDDSIVRLSDLDMSKLRGILPVSKGGTNNNSYASNKLIYYDGTKFSSFPINTGTIVISGSSINIVAGSGLVGGGLTSIPNGTVVLSISDSADILVEENSISLTNTGVPGTYSKIITDNKGRVVSGTSLTNSDILSILGYTPWHPGNDGSGSGLDADLLDGQQGSFYRNSANLSGTLNTDILPDLHPEPKTGTKFIVNTKGLVTDSFFANTEDIISSLGYTPLNANADAVKQGSLDIRGSLSTQAGDVSFYDNLPLFGTNRADILPSDPRGFTFNYGGIVTNKTGILAYYPTENQLKLITNIFASGSNVDGNEADQDDMNGGDASSIFIIENLQGNALTVLFREVADQLYLDVNNTQTILGLKRFLGQIEVFKEIKILTDGNPPTSPPLVLYGNNLKVENLNADLLDDKHGTYYSNAANMTGSFDYTKVSFDHIVGENNYIPKFTDPSTPSKRIASSNILQRTDGNIEISNARNLIVGEDDNDIFNSSTNTLIVGENNTVESENSASIGFNNTVEGFNSLAAGQNNITSGNNSVALNFGSITKADKSVAMGSYGLTQLENQLAFGAFRTVDGNEVLEHGQYSTIAMYLRGRETNGSWVSLSPVISLPTDKTISYNIELLINKGLSSGVAHYTFTSGIINNATYRNLFNITEILNSTTVPNTGTKTEVFNNSQIRRHYHFWNYRPGLDDVVNRISQYVNVFEPPVINSSINIRNVDSQYFYIDPDKVHTTGIFEKDFDGKLILDIDKPRYSAIFSQTLDDPNIKIRSKDHGIISNTMVDIQSISGSKYFFPSQRYKALAVLDKNTFFIESPSWTGTKITENNLAKIKINNIDNYDELLRFNTNVYLESNILYLSSSLVNKYNYSIGQLVKPDTSLRIVHSGADGVFAYNRLVREIRNDQIIINYPIFTTGQAPIAINGLVNVTINDYSYDIFKMCDKVHVNTEIFDISGGKTRTSGMFLPDPSLNIVNDGGQGSFAVPVQSTLLSPQNSGVVPDLDIYNSPSFSVLLPFRLNNIPDGSEVTIRPMFVNNSGHITLYHKDTFDCTYSSTYSEFNKHNGSYIRWKDAETSKHKLTIFDTNNKPVVFISNPSSYVFGSGFLSEKNSLFYIKQEYTKYYLYSKEPLDYEESNIIPVKIKAIPYSPDVADSFEKVLYVYLEDQKENPYVLNPIPNTGIVVDNLFSYTVPLNTFDDSDKDIIRYSAEIRGGHSLPRWLNFDSTSLSFSGIPDICDIGAYSIDVLAIDDDGLSIKDNFIIEVLDNPATALEGFVNNVESTLRIQNIYLSQNTLKENSSPGTLIGELKQVGGYDPYVTFLTAENTFSGIIRKNSDLIRSCKPNILSFIPATISGSPEYLSIGSKINFKDLSNSILATNLKVKNVYKPTVFSGTPLSSNQIILDDVYRNYKSSVLFDNQKLPTDKINDSFGLGLRVKSFDDYSITLANYLVQERDIVDSTLILTENEEAIVHDIPGPFITYNIEDELSKDDLCEEDGTSTLKYSDYHGYDNVTWSDKNSYSFLMLNNEKDCLLEKNNDKFITTNISNLEIIDKKPHYVSINLTSENNHRLLDDSYSPIKGYIIDDIWYSNPLSKIYRSFHPGVPQQASNTEGLPNLLSSLNFASGVDTLLQSNIDYSQEDENLEKYDYWYFDQPINNSVLYTKNLGSEDYCHFLSETRNYSGVYYPEAPFEYGILCTQDGHGLISDTKTDHGSQIEVSTRYEILESINVFNNNGGLFTELLLNNILCENEDKIVHDYVISSRNGSAYILFPGKIQQAKFKYSKEKSYSSSRINNDNGYIFTENLLYGLVSENYDRIVEDNRKFIAARLNGYYDDDPTLVPQFLKSTEHNFYYSWGKLISYKLYTNEYVIRTDSIYNGVTSSGSVVYLGDIPDSGNYSPEFLQDQTFIRLSGNCPEPFESGGMAGFGTRENYNPLGEYVTGLVSFYSDFTSNNIRVNSRIDINQDARNTDYVRMYNPTTNIINAQLPRVGDYLSVKNLSKNSFTVENFFLYPSTYNVTHTGSITVNLDRNHQQRIKSPDIINRVPIYFNNIYSSNQNRLPKNSLFDIINISGNKIYTRDDANYTLKNSSYPDYFDHSISGKYITNGAYFLGSLFHNNSIIYDLRPTLKNFNQVYPLVTFEFDKTKQKLSINIPSGIVKIFDNVKLSNFKPLFPFMPWDSSRPYNTGFTVYPNALSIRSFDDTEDKDFVLLERSAAILQPENIERLSFSTNMFDRSVSGTCTLDTKIANRLQKGYIINYENNTHNQSGHQIETIQDGYSFSGVIPRNNNILSSNQIINDHRIGYASVVSTGSAALISGIQTLSFVNSNDIGYTEFYKINTSGFSPNDIMINGVEGKGSSHLPYKLFVDVTGTGVNKNTRFIELLYLGHNINTINFSGIISTSGSRDIRISRISLSDQLQIERLLKLGYSSGVEPILETGTNTREEKFVFSIPSVNRFDIVQIRIDHSLNNFTNYHRIYSYATESASPLPVKLIYPSSINTSQAYYPSYLANTENLFHILPCIYTTVKHCNSTVLPIKNNDIFYNGNIIKLEELDSVKSFLNYDDQIRLLSLNNNLVKDTLHLQKIDNSNNRTSITGITISGPLATPPSTYEYPNLGLLDSTTRHSLTLGTDINRRTPISGVAEFVGYNSGSFELLTDNNIFVQSHGGSSSRWPQDPTGKLVDPPITGVYSVAPDNTSFCSSGTLCVIISGYRNRRLDNLSFDKKYYFDFSDDFPSINNTYSLKDKISPNVISISVPYNPDYFGRSGIVHIIDSDYNIKSNLNPNINNVFLSNSAVLKNAQSDGSLSYLVKRQIHYFDNNSKKWTHMYHMIDTLPAYSSYPISFQAGSSSFASKLVHYPESPINITNVLRLTDPISNTFAALPNNTLSIFNDESSVILKIITIGGSPILEDRVKNIPKIFISGIGEYRTITNSSLYDYRPAISGWEVGMEIIPFRGTGVFPVTVAARDETGSANYSFTLDIKERPRATVSYPTGYASLTSNYWKLYFDVKGIDLLNNNPNNGGLFVSGSPNDLNYNFVRHSSSELEVIGYPAGGGFATGLWNPVIKIADSVTGRIAASGSGTVLILDSLNDRPAYVPIVNNFDSEKYVNLSKLERISYTVPVLEIDQDHSSILTSLNGGIYFSSNRTDASYDPEMNRFRIEYSPQNTGDSNYLNESIYASNRIFNYSVSQPVYAGGSKTWNNYSSPNYLQNITFYRPVTIDTSFINDVPSFKINEPWSIEFVVDEGITKYRPTTPPRVTLFNTPGIGRISYQYLSYTLSYKYNNTDKNWIVTAVGKPDIYGRFAPSTGSYTIDIFVDDTRTSFARDSIDIKYVELNEIRNILPNIYTSPNNEFFIQADVAQEYKNGVVPSITFDGENTLYINYSSMYKKYDPNLKIWDITGTGNKMTEKWDSRLVINPSSPPSLTLQVKGIATDKITSVAKINLLELQNNNRDIIDALPIKITGIGGLTPDSGIIIPQGDRRWSLGFKTIRGLASPQHPPTIILENTPTFCTGYDPRLDPAYAVEEVDPNLQNSCISSPIFDVSDKSWTFSFSGPPSCTLLGPIDFSITAIDTDLTLASPYIEPSDKVDSLFTYTAIEGEHPGPQIIGAPDDEDGPPNNTVLKPFCDELYYQKLKFGPRFRRECPVPTGLKSLSFSGSLPSGLSYSFTYPSSSETNSFNAPIYDNLSSGTIIIQGYPLAFAQNGDTYDEKFYITVTDARNKTGSMEISFVQSLEYNKPNIGMRVYFESDKPVFTPSAGLALIKADAAFAYRPQPAAFELSCNSVLPNNKCPSKTIIYSGGPDSDNKLILLGVSDVNEEIYIRINKDDNNINNGVYTTKIDSNMLTYITTREDFSPRTGLADIVVSKYEVLEIGDFKKFFQGDIQTNSSCILGNGLVDIPRVAGAQGLQYGIRGHISPSLSGDIPFGGYLSESDIRLTGLVISPLYNDSNNYSQVAYTNCWETGYLRVSGIILPKIFIEITDPPPAFSDNFSVNGSTFALNTRLSHGNSELERSNPINWRNGSADYILKNVYRGNTILQNTITVSTANQQSIPINASVLAASANNYGAVFGLTISSSGDTFPTYNYRAKPTAQPADYFWIHKATTTLFDIPTQNSLPPVVPCLPNSINIVSGVLINYNNRSPSDYGIDGLAYGGYVPHSICFNGQCPPEYSNFPYFLTSEGVQWSARNYLPKISGVILQSTTDKEFFPLNGSYDPHTNPRVLRIINTQSLATGQIVKFNVFNKNVGNNSLSLIETFTTGLLSTDFNSVNDIVFAKDYGFIFPTLEISGSLVNQLTSIDTSTHRLHIKHDNLDNKLNISDNIAINSDFVSSTLNALSYPGTLTVTYINSTEMIVQANGPEPTGIYAGFNTGDYLKIEKIIEDNIKTMPNNVSSSSEGVYNFIISGRANVLYGQYIYRIMTKENNLMPIFTTEISPKSFERNIPMFVSKPLEIISTTVSWPGNSWTIQIIVSGGRLPALSETIDVKIDLDSNDQYNYCGFNRFPTGALSDSYDPITDTTTLTLSSNTRVAWQAQTAFNLKLQDSTGSIVVPVSKPPS